MKTLIKHGIGAAALLAFFSTTAWAQATATANVTATVTVAAKARLEITGAVAFADADPETTPIISAAALDITVKARTSPTETVTLTVAADGDFQEAGGASIGINNLSWLVSGAGFAPGTAALTDVSVGSWGGPGTRNGTQTYRLANSWAYAVGSYTATLTYTLTVP
jgi:hypothetical protein